MLKAQNVYALLTIGVTLFLALHWGQAASYIEQKAKLEKTNGDIADLDWDRGINLKENQDVHSRSKRFFSFILSIASAIFGSSSFTFGGSQQEQSMNEMRQTYENIGYLEDHITRLSAAVNSLKIGQQWLEGAILFADDEQRLTFFLEVLSTQLTLDQENNVSLVPASAANEWANAVLDLHPGGVNELLYNFHNMMVGTSNLFGRTPIFVLYEASLSKAARTYEEHVQNIKEYLYAIQVAGYVAWATALNVKGRNSEVAAVQQLGRERMAAQEEVLAALAIEWPTGTYGLPMTNTGCPVNGGATWSEGQRYQDTESYRYWQNDEYYDNQWTSGIHFPASFSTTHIQQHFCMKTSSRQGRGGWPSGDYCIFKKYSCPTGFSSGMIKWDDEDDDNANRFSGVLPDGVYDDDVTKIYYCCRNDGNASDPIALPNHQPFYLFRFHDSCQQVRGLNVADEYFYWNNEDDDNSDSKYGSIPYEDGGYRNHKLHYCYYS